MRFFCFLELLAPHFVTFLSGIQLHNIKSTYRHYFHNSKCDLKILRWLFRGALWKLRGGPDPLDTPLDPPLTFTVFIYPKLGGLSLSRLYKGQKFILPNSVSTKFTNLQYPTKIPQANCKYIYIWVNLATFLKWISKFSKMYEVEPIKIAYRNSTLSCLTVPYSSLSGLSTSRSRWITSSLHHLTLKLSCMGGYERQR